MTGNRTAATMSRADFYSQFPNIEKHVDLGHAPRPFHFELPPHLRGLHSGFDLHGHHGIKNGVVQERIMVSPKTHEVRYDRTTLKHNVKQGK